MRLPLIFPLGKPKRLELTCKDFLGPSVVSLPAWFKVDVDNLLQQKELYAHAHGVGQIRRYAAYWMGLEDAQRTEEALQSWAQGLAPYWKTELVDQFFYELDEVADGVHALRPGHLAHQCDIQLRRDALESVAQVSSLFEGPYLEFELFRIDESIAPIFKERARPLPLPWTRQVIFKRIEMARERAPDAWWLGP